MKKTTATTVKSTFLALFIVATLPFIKGTEKLEFS